MNGVWLIAISLVTGLAVSYAVATTEPVVTCLPDSGNGQGQSYERHSRGFPLHFTSQTLKVPACKKYAGPSCATTYCDKYPGLDEPAGIKIVPLLVDVAIWTLAAAGILYMLSAIFIRA